MPPRARVLAVALAALLPALGNVYATVSPARAGLGRALLPDQVRLQFAGGQGLLSAGPGWAFWTGRLQAETLYGYAPAAVAGRSLHALSLKATASPGSFGPGKPVAVTPLLLGVSANVALGDDYVLIPRDKSRDYYWPSALRFWIFGGMRADFPLPGEGRLRALSAVVEAGAQDAYWQAWAGNDAVRLSDILSLSLAVQAHFRE